MIASHLLFFKGIWNIAEGSTAAVTQISPALLHTCRTPPLAKGTASISNRPARLTLRRGRTKGHSPSFLSSPIVRSFIQEFSFIPCKEAATPSRYDIRAT